jgi:hypothetical protein
LASRLVSLISGFEKKTQNLVFCVDERSLCRMIRSSSEQARF